MPSTANKGYEVQVTGSNIGTWGTVLNDNMISYVDANMGGLTTLSLTSSNVTLTTAQSRSAILRCTGVLLANIQITTACIGFFFVENLTSGAFTVTITNGVSGVVVPQSTRATLIADGTNGVRVASSDGFPPSTSMSFFNSTVPTGWTLDTSANNACMRLVSSTGGGTGGTADFTAAFSARTIAQANIPNYALPVTDPGHAHNYTVRASTDGVGGGGSGGWYNLNTNGGTTTTDTTGITVASGGSGTAMDFAVKYVNVVRGTKA